MSCELLLIFLYMCDVFVFLRYLIFFVEILVGGFFFGFSKLNLSLFFLRLRTRYLSVKSPVLFDFLGLS